MPSFFNILKNLELKLTFKFKFMQFYCCFLLTVYMYDSVITVLTFEFVPSSCQYHVCKKSIMQDVKPNVACDSVN